MDKIRLQKFISQAGLTSRRKAEELIAQGLVKVNGQTICTLGVKVDPVKDIVCVNGRTVEIKQGSICIMLNKPRGYTCTKRIFKGEKNVFALLPKYKHLHCVGRLDKNSTGLLLLTNDGELTYRLTHPRFEQEKEYKVSMKRHVGLAQQKILLRGVDIGEGNRQIVRAKIIKQITPTCLSIVITQGYKRQLRRMFDAIGHKVASLKRIRIKNLYLGDLKQGKWRRLSAAEQKALYDL